AASVRPEPGSNSPCRYFDYRPLASSNRIIDTGSYRLGDGFNHWFIRADCLLQSRRTELSFARCTKGISSRATEIARGRELINGTNFRHAVEFSRSGRTPSQPFRADRGQPTIRYPVGCARSNRTSHRPSLPTWGPRAA